MKDPREVSRLIEENVMISTLLSDVGVELRQLIKPEQFSCPIHGRDTSMSARHYPDTNSMYCWTCKKAWNPISFTMDLKGLKYMAAAEHLANRFNVDLSEVREIASFEAIKKRSVIKGNVDKRKMAMYAMVESVQLCKHMVPPDTYGKMVYLLANAKHLEDEKEFAKIVMPVAKKIADTLDYK